MNESHDEILNKIHYLELKIALEIKRICEKNNIKYFVTAGTLLGAVRHGGFIPWDDDMDIGMLRKDYEEFLKCCSEDLGEEFYLQTWNTDENFPFSFGKIRLIGTHFIEGFTEDTNINNGIFVDIFPYDSVPDNKIKRFIQSKEYFIYKRLLWIKKGMGQNMKESKSKAIKFYLFKIFSIFFTYDRIKKHFEKIQKKYNNKLTHFIVADGSYSYKKESIPRNWTDNLELVNFETQEFPTYKNKMEYLKYFYGDFMKLPPEKDRNRHMLRCVDFGKYEELFKKNIN